MKKLSTAGFLKGVSEFLRGYFYKQDVDKQWNEQRHLFAFTNGVLNLKTYQFRPISPEDYITITCSYPFRPIQTEEKEKVLTLLSDIFPDEEVLTYMLTALSRSLEGNPTDEVFHVLTGSGANGKSCLMDSLCKIVFGEYYQTFSVSYITKESDGRDRPLPELAMAQYARMLVTSEPDAKDRFQVNILKNLTGNEEVIYRGMYAKDPTRYMPQFNMWILANEIPNLSKYDGGLERRMRCVHFGTRFCHNPTRENEKLRDDTLKDKIKQDESWKYGLLGLLVDAHHESRGPLIMPETVKAFTEGYLLENNPVGLWLKTKYERTGYTTDRIPTSEAFRIFVADMGPIKTQKTFHEDMRKAHVEKKTMRGIEQYYGIKRIEDENPINTEEKEEKEEKEN